MAVYRRLGHTYCRADVAYGELLNPLLRYQLQRSINYLTLTLAQLATFHLFLYASFLRVSKCLLLKIHAERKIANLITKKFMKK